MGPALGIIVALASILLGNIWEGGHVGSLLGGPAALIVFGGTIGAVLVQYPLPTVSHALKAAAGTFKKPANEPSKILDEIVDYANKARKDGILALEKVAPNASDPFLAKALMMAVDGTDTATLRDTMETTISQQEHHGEESGKVFEAAGGYAPTVGIIGAVLGLIHVMSNLSDINAVGTGIAGAFVATVYGVGAANIVFLPIGTRIKIQVHENTVVKEMMLVGVLSIQEGTNPKVIRDRLLEFLPSHGHEGGGHGAAAKAAG
jgi:chemotaxis protein MotA